MLGGVVPHSTPPQTVADAGDYAEAIVRTLRDPVLILSADLRVQTANEAFYRMFKVSREESEGRLVYDLGDGQWNIPRLRELLQGILPHNSFFDDFEVLHTFPAIGRRTMLLNARKLDGAEGRPAEILLGIRDVSELLQYQGQMRRSEIRYRRLFEAAHDGVLILDAVSRKTIDANPFIMDLLGYPREELLGKELWEIGLLRDQEASHAAFQELQEKGRIRYEDLPLQSKSGKKHEVEVVANRYKEDDHHVIQCNIRDITERKRTERALQQAYAELRKSEERYRDLFHLSPMAVYTIDSAGVIQNFNHHAVEMWGREPAVGDTDQRFCGSFKMFRPDGSFMSHDQCPMAEVVSGKLAGVHDGEVHIERPDGSRVVVLVDIRPLKDDHGDITGAINCFYDITDRKQMETELRAWQGKLTSRVAQQKAQLAEEAMERKRLEDGIAQAVEIEQERLGQELHDGIAQELTGIGMMLEVLADTLVKRSPIQGLEAGRLRAMLGKVTASTRDLAKSFYPVELETHGLLLALQELAKFNQERFGILCAVEAPETPLAHLKDERAIQLFRIAQEAVHNAAKHSQAKHIHIRLATENGNWVLAVKDDGVGLQSGSQQAKGIGLRIMQYRTNMIGGAIQVRNDDGGGVIVSCVVPAGQSAVSKTESPRFH